MNGGIITERSYIPYIIIGAYLVWISTPFIPTVIITSNTVNSDMKEAIIAQYGNVEYISLVFDSVTALALVVIISAIGLYLVSRSEDIVMYRIICEYKDKKKQNKSEQKPEA